MAMPFFVTFPAQKDKVIIVERDLRSVNVQWRKLFDVMHLDTRSVYPSSETILAQVSSHCCVVVATGLPCC